MALTQTSIPTVTRTRTSKLDPDILDALTILADEAHKADDGRSTSAFTTEPAPFEDEKGVKLAASRIRAAALDKGISAGVVANVDAKAKTYALTFWGLPRRTRVVKAKAQSDAS